MSEWLWVHPPPPPNEPWVDELRPVQKSLLFFVHVAYFVSAKRTNIELPKLSNELICSKIFLEIDNPQS